MTTTSRDLGRHELVLAAQPCQIEAHVDRVLELLPEALRADDVRIGLVEALGNAIVHGALGVSYDARARGELEATLTAIDEAAALRGAKATVTVAVDVEWPLAEITITDGGPGFDWRAQTTGGGLGLTILRGVFGAVHWNDRGNKVTLSIAPRP